MSNYNDYLFTSQEATGLAYTLMKGVDEAKGMLDDYGYELLTTKKDLKGYESGLRVIDLNVEEN